MSENPDKLTEDVELIKKEFKDELGFWHESLDLMLETDPEFIRVLFNYLSYPYRKGPLDPKTKALIAIAVNVSPTLLHKSGTKQYIHLAFENGATTEEILEVIEMVVAIGNHSVARGTPILLEKEGLPQDLEDDEKKEHARIREEFKDKRGYWDEGKEPRLKIDPEHFEHYLHLSAHPWENGVIDEITRELIYIAVDASATHDFEYGVEVHIQSALDQGATRAEILEALQIAACVGFHSVSVGVLALAEVAKERGKM